MAETTALTAATAGDGRVLCLLGVERVGRSASSRLVRSLDIDVVAEADSVEGTVSGEAGRHPLVEINDAILGAFAEGQTSSPPLLPRGFETDPRLRGARERARQAIARRGERWAWRDPRLALTLPFWRDLLPRRVHVLSISNPCLVVDSYVDRDLAPSPEHAGALWLRLNAAALVATRGEPRVLLFGDDAREDLGRKRAWIAELLGDRPATNGNSALAGLAEEPEGSLADVARDERLPVEVPLFYLGLYAAVRSARIAGRGGPDDGLARATRTLPALWKALEDRLLLAADDKRLVEDSSASSARPEAQEIERLRADAESLKHELEIHRQFLSSMKSSLSWRLTSPLRMLKARLSRRRG